MDFFWRANRILLPAESRWPARCNLLPDRPLLERLPAEIRRQNGRRRLEIAVREGFKDIADWIVRVE